MRENQTQSTRETAADRGQILHPITLQGTKKETFSSCNFTTRGFIDCPLVRPCSDTRPNLGVGVGCAGVQMLCLTSLSLSTVFKSAWLSSRAIVIRHWTQMRSGKRRCEGEISWECISTVMVAIERLNFSLKTWAVACSRFSQLFYILKITDGGLLIVVHERSSDPSVLKAGFAAKRDTCYRPLFLTKSVLNIDLFFLHFRYPKPLWHCDILRAFAVTSSSTIWLSR